MADALCEAPRRRLPCFAGGCFARFGMLSFAVGHVARFGRWTRRTTTVAAHGPDVGTHVVMVCLIVRLHLSDGQCEQTRRHLRKHGIYVNHARPQLTSRVLPVVSYSLLMLETPFMVECIFAGTKQIRNSCCVMLLLITVNVR